jgi:hypothetical protein
MPHMEHNPRFKGAHDSYCRSNGKQRGTVHRAHECTSHSDNGRQIAGLFHTRYQETASFRMKRLTVLVRSTTPVLRYFCVKCMDHSKWQRSSAGDTRSGRTRRAYIRDAKGIQL